MTEKEYGKLVEELSPPSPMGRDCLNAFWVGGLICTLGQLLLDYAKNTLQMEKDMAGSFCSISLVLVSALLTGFGLYAPLVKFGGAGALVPITGFANSVAAPAIEFQKEGQVFGIGCKIFTIAGPVIVYGLSASVVYGVIYWLFTAL